MKKARPRATSILKKIDPSHWESEAYRKRAEKLLRSFRGRKILVIGDLGVDRYTQGVVERISPEAPVPIMWVADERLKLGLAANVADNVVALGGEPLLVGVVGRDRSAEDFKILLKKANIQARYLVEDLSRRTALKERLVTESQQLLRVDYESLKPVSKTIQSKILTQIQTLVKKADAVVVEDYAKGLLTTEVMRKIFQVAASEGKLSLADPNSKSPAAHYWGAQVLTPNRKEAESLTGKAVDPSQVASLQETARLIFEKTACEHLVLTLGRDGMALATRGKNEIVRLPTNAREVFDVSGAGDTVISVLALTLASGASLEDAAILSNIAAGVEVAKRGTATVSPKEILDHLKAR